MLCRTIPNPHEQQCFARPSCILKPNTTISSLPRPSTLARPPLPDHTSKVPSHIPHPVHSTRAVTACPSVEDLLLHLSTLNPLPSANVNEETWTLTEPHLVLTPPAEPEKELEAKRAGSLDSQARSTASYSLFPKAAYHLQ